MPEVQAQRAGTLPHCLLLCLVTHGLLSNHSHLMCVLVYSPCYSIGP